MLIIASKYVARSKFQMVKLLLSGVYERYRLNYSNPIWF